MNRFIIRRNIRRYLNLLELEPDETRRRMLLDLLAEEETKLAELPDVRTDVGSPRVQRSD